MSLFKLKPIWTKSFSAEEFDQRHLAVGKLGRQASIALASFEGWLRVYIINRPDELSISTVYENKFESGIIDVKFVSHPDQKIKNNAIGILFYRRFTYLYFDSNPENKYIPKLVSIDVEPAFGIGISPVCLFTLNSTIQYLNPIEILKIKVADPIYPYTLNFDKTYFVDGQELVEMEGSTQQWRIIVGRIRQLFVFIDTIVVIGQRALWQICDAKIAKTKVMQEDISCGAIAFKSINSYNILTANFNNQLFVYSSNYELLWAIKLDYVAIKIIVCQHEEIKGMLTILSDQGTLQLAYSGVQVPDSVIQPLSQKIDYSVVQAQTQAFLDKLKANDDKKQKKPQRISEAKQGYKIYFGQIQKSYESLQQKDKLYQIDGKIVKYRLFIETTSRQILRNFKVQINLPFNLYSIETNKQSTVTRLGDKIVFDIYANNESFPYERQINVIIRYQNDQLRGSPFIKIQNVDIPMGLQCIIAGFESKQSFQNKIVIKSNVEMPSFNDLFPDLINRKSAQQKKTIRFVLSNGIECVITYNKGFNKAKIQSKQYSGLCYIISQFANHIRLINLKLQTKIDLSVQIPLQEFFSIMKQHYDYRLKLKESFEEVQLKAEQFKNSQKKLVVRMKEKMTNLGSMDKILEYTFQRVVQSSTKYEQISHEMDIINHNLCVAIKLIIELLFIRSNPSEKAKNIANGILGYEKQSLQYGWQQKIYANSCYYLNKKFKKKDSISLQQLQKIPLFVISKVNNGDWN